MGSQINQAQWVHETSLKDAHAPCKIRRIHGVSYMEGRVNVDTPPCKIHDAI
jgi:hypothetical protein